MTTIARVPSETYQENQCTVVSHARALAAWIGDGKPLTPKGVLRPADARLAAKAVGIGVPAHFRSAADVTAIHHPWLVAVATGMVTVDTSGTTATPATEDGDPLALWLTGLDAVLAAESHDRHRQGATILCRALLTVLATDPPPARDEVSETVYQLLEHLGFDDAYAASQAFSSHTMLVDGALNLLAEFGAIDEQARLTALGHWGRQQLQARVPAPVTPELPASELLARLAKLPEDERWREAQPWLHGRAVAEAAEALLHAADSASPAERLVAVELVDGLGEPAEPALRRALDLPNVATHAQWMLGIEGDAADLDDIQRCWLVTEYALATLTDRGVEDAHHYLQEQGGVDNIDGGGHPDADTLRKALAEFAAAGGGRVRIYQLKIELRRFRPPVWRRVQLPAGASLATVHQIIRVVFDWGDDHLHAFTTADGARYSDPFYQLEECGDEYEGRLAKTMPRPDTTMTYVYDFGDWWEHRITLEQILDPDHTATYPTCVAGRGDAPVEDWDPEFPTDPAPFDRVDINRRLATLAARVPIG